MVDARPLARRLLLPFDVRLLVLLALLAAAGLTFAQAAQPAASTDCIVLDDFSAASLGEFPPGWAVRKDDGKEVYRVREEGRRHFLQAVSKGLGIQAGRETEQWDLATHPVLAFRSAPNRMPSDSMNETISLFGK